MIEQFYAKADHALSNSTVLQSALRALADEYPPGVEKSQLKRILAKLESGVTFRELAQDRRFAGWLPVILAGINQPSAIRQVSSLLEKAAWESRQRKIRLRIFTYPLFLIGLAALILLLFHLLIVPTFAIMFDDFGLNLPLFTAGMVKVSRTLLMYPVKTLFICMIVALIALSCCYFWSRNALTTRLFGNSISGNSVNLYAMASFVDTLANLLAINAPPGEALRIAGRSSRHIYFEKAALQLAEDIEREGTSSLNSHATLAFPPNVIYALSLQPSKGIALLQELGKIYSERVQSRYDWTQWILGPVVILIAGGAVLLCVAGLFLPLIRLTMSLSG